jgi:uncharacterized protein (TIGR02271 family)
MTTGPAPTPIGPDDTPGRDYLLRSEEQLRVRTDRVVSGHARLEKFTVTETKTITVEVTHEEVRLVQRGADGSGPDQQTPGDATADADRWMVLSREEVVVTTRVVPVERVRLEVYPVVEQRQVTDQVRKEQIDGAAEINATATQNNGPLSGAAVPGTTPKGTEL